MSESNQLPLLVVGAGIAGISAALEAAEAGAEVVLVEREPSVGGRVLRSYHYFPKLCPPSCGMEINTRRIEFNPRVRVLTETEVTAAEKNGDGWKVTLRTAPQYVTDRCTCCGECEAACATEIDDPFNLGMCRVKAIRLYHPNAWPKRFVFDRQAVSDDEAAKLAEVCPYDAIDPSAEATSETIEVSSVVVTTGWDPYPITKLPELGGGVYNDVIANVQMERLASPSGPTAGKILRPSDGKPPTKVAFVQCAGSRDVNHLPYCSGVCCLASFKQAMYVNEQLPDAEVTIYYIDRRAPGRNEDVLTRAAEIEGVRIVKGKVGKVEEGPDGMLVLRFEDVENTTLREESADLVVLATGMQPSIVEGGLALVGQQDEDGFALDDPSDKVFAAGVARGPVDVATSVRQATGAAARAWAGRRA
jgi:quinone-modifying oxidoreductase subunit QmoA